MDGAFYNDLREPFITADLPTVTLAATNKALYRAGDMPSLGPQYMARPGKKILLRMFGKITTAATPGNLTMALLWGTGADANGVSLVASAAQTLVAGQTNLSWEAEFHIRCASIGSAGTLFAWGRAFFNTAVIAAGDVIIPASAAVVSGAVDLTAALIPSLQVLRSGSTVETMTIQDLEFVALN